jgi:hypothetical protein
MTEQEARQVLLLQAHEAEAGPHWSAQDRAWATQQAVAVVGEQATPERFVVARAAFAIQRLRQRDASAVRWLDRHPWHPAWVWVGALFGFIAGLVADQLGPPEHVNLLAPAVWIVVVWNLVVYIASLMPWRGGVGSQVGPWFARRGRGADLAISLVWARHAAPLSMKRAAVVLHTAAAALALGLVAGLYLRGLVLDYRAGWQSTFLDAPTVQGLLDTLLAPASLVTGIAVPQVASLRVGPGSAAQASAAPWIHLYATTLLLWVVWPRLAFAAWSAWRSGALSRRFPLALDAPYFEALHPLMRPGQSRVVRLMWVAPPAAPPVRLLGQLLPAELAAPLTLLRSDEGDELQLVPPHDQTPPARPRWWGGWRATRETAAPQADAVLLLGTHGEALAWQRPVLVLRDAEEAEAPALPLRRLADGWLADGRLLQALCHLLEGDARLVRLSAAWTLRQQTLRDAGVGEIAETLVRVAGMREVLPERGNGLLGAGRADTDAARERARDSLLASLEQELSAHRLRLFALLGRAAPDVGDAHGVPAAELALRGRVGEGRAAIMGGLVSGAVAGLNADLLSGGLTMGAGALAGGLLGALGAAGAARGLNVLRGTDRSHVTWDEMAMVAITTTLLQRWAVLLTGLPHEACAQDIAAAVEDRRGELVRAWSLRGADDGVRERSLQAPLSAALLQALGGPAA